MSPQLLLVLIGLSVVALIAAVSAYAYLRLHGEEHGSEIRELAGQIQPDLEFIRDVLTIARPRLNECAGRIDPIIRPLTSSGSRSFCYANRIVEALERRDAELTRLLTESGEIERLREAAHLSRSSITFLNDAVHSVQGAPPLQPLPLRDTCRLLAQCLLEVEDELASGELRKVSGDGT